MREDELLLAVGGLLLGGLVMYGVYHYAARSRCTVDVQLDEELSVVASSPK